MEDLNPAASITTRNGGRSQPARPPCNPTAGHLKRSWSRSKCALRGKHTPCDNAGRMQRRGGHRATGRLRRKKVLTGTRSCHVTAGPHRDTKLPRDGFHSQVTSEGAGSGDADTSSYTSVHGSTAHSGHRRVDGETKRGMCGRWTIIQP